MKEILAEAQKASKERAQSKLESQSEYQNRKRMTPEERARGAIDYMTKDMKRLSEESGKEITEDSARRFMTNIAQEAERQKK
jgi:pyruvate-formate lyase-activating enzyme